MMLLGPISLLDCVVFVLYLIPNLLVLAGPLETLSLVRVLPFLSKYVLKSGDLAYAAAGDLPSGCSSGVRRGVGSIACTPNLLTIFPVFQLPCQFVQERYIRKKDQQSPFVRKATVFEDIVIRCVRYAFARIPASIGRVFFSKWVVYPFFWFRLLRHGYLKSPIRYSEIDRDGARGLWIMGDAPDGLEKPDLVVYYLHGGGFSMGSSYFYLEFLIAWLTMLKARGFRHPAIFTLEYSLVPDETWPKQFEETKAGYRFLCNYVDSSSICVSGDSAGATLVMSLLLGARSERPGLAMLLSPWTHLVSEKLNRNTSSDYLDSGSLHLYAKQYAGKDGSVEDPVLSPGRTEASSDWRVYSPTKGYHVIYGAEEVFAPGIEETIKSIKRSGAIIESSREEAGIHAWPVVNLFLADAIEARLHGLRRMTEVVYSNMGPKLGRKG